jgi:hypothetical protein
MAGDWIKMRASLCTHPKVLLIASIIGESTEIGRRLSTGFNGALDEIVTSDVTRDVTLAALLRVWCATNEHTSDGVWHGSTLKTLDYAAGIHGFGEAMERAGWAIYDEEKSTVTLPNFLENNAPAKNNARSTSAERQARYRDKKKAKSDVTSDVTVSVTSNAREEKRREEKKEEKKTTPAPSAWVSSSELVSDGLPEDLASEWLAHRKARKAKLTALAWAGFKAEVAKAGWSVEDAVRKAIARNWTAFEADWVAKAQPPPRHSYADQQRAQLAALTGARTTQGDVIDV